MWTDGCGIDDATAFGIIGRSLNGRERILFVWELTKTMHTLTVAPEWGMGSRAKSYFSDNNHYFKAEETWINCNVRTSLIV